MSPRILVILVLACAIVFGMVIQPDAMTEPLAMISERVLHSANTASVFSVAVRSVMSAAARR